MSDHWEHQDIEPIEGPVAPLAPRPRGYLAAAPGGRFEGPAIFDAEPSIPKEAWGGLSLRTLLQAKWQIIGVFLLVIILALPPIWLFIKPNYQATAKVRAEKVAPHLVYSQDEPGELRFLPWFMNTQIAMLTSTDVLKKALEHPEVRKTAWYSETPRSLRTLLGAEPPNRVERLQDELDVQQQEFTELIQVKLATREPTDPHVIVNAVVDEYLKYREAVEHERKEELYKSLTEEQKSVEREIEQLVDQKATLSKQLGTDDPDIVRAQLATQLTELEMEQKKLQRAFDQTSYALERREDAGQTLPDEPKFDVQPDQMRYANDSEWARRKQSLDEAKHALELGRQRLGERNPRLKELESNVAYAQQRLNERTAQLGPGWQGSPGGPVNETDKEMDAVGLMSWTPEMLAWQKDQQARELKVLEAQIDAVKEEQAEKGDLAKQVAQVADQLHRKNELYEALHDRIQGILVEQKAPPRVSIASNAVAPTQPYKDRRLLLTVMVMAMGMVAGVVVAHLRSTVDPRIREMGDLQRTMRVPFLGQLPYVRVRNESALATPPIVVECMRMVRTALLERLAGTGKKVVLITSASSRAGKTSVSIELSRSLARVGKRTLLVEADLRRPMVGERLGLDCRNGLATVLCGRLSDADAIQATDLAKLDVLVAGEFPEDFEPERLANGQFTACIARWRKNYDYVIVDSAPILPVADTRIIAGQTDGAIMVSRSAHSRRSEVVQACADLSAAGGSLLGTVLVGTRAGAGYGRAYGYAYGAGGQYGSCAGADDKTLKG